MGKTQEIICAIEFGTSKISVLFGSIDSDQTMQVEGFGSIPSMNAIVKGEITFFSKASFTKVFNLTLPSEKNFSILELTGIF